MAQIRKAKGLNKKINHPEAPVRRAVLDFCYVTAVPKGEAPVAYLSFNHNGYSTYCHVFRKYWDWVAKRSAERCQNTVQHGKSYDAKNRLHLFRLLQMAGEIAATGQVHVRRPNREFLLQIRRGEFKYEPLVAEAEQMLMRVEAAFAVSALPKRQARKRRSNC